MLAGGTVPASAASVYDTVTASSMRTLVVAMESYAMLDGDGAYTDVTEDALSDRGWSVGRSGGVQPGAVGRGIHRRCADP